MYHGLLAANTGLHIEDFGTLVRPHRDKTITGKLREGGVCLYINQKRCKTVIVYKEVCKSDIEMLTVSQPVIQREKPVTKTGQRTTMRVLEALRILNVPHEMPLLSQT